jgi:hypothetical protein
MVPVVGVPLLTTMLLRAISLPTHGALELAAGLAVAVTPLALGFTPAAVVAAVFLGAVMVGLALGASAPRGTPTVPVRAHAAYDKLLAAALVATGLGAAIVGSVELFAFFVVAGLAYGGLIAVTRYSVAAT